MIFAFISPTWRSDVICLLIGDIFFHVMLKIQELLAYQDMSALYPALCQKMQMDIIDVLVEKVYVADDNCSQKCKCLIAKGRVLRASGIEGLKGCIKYLSDVISMMVSFL